MSHYISQYLAACGEQEMAGDVEQMHNRLEAFSDGLDRAALDCAIKAAEEAIEQRDELLAVLETVRATLPNALWADDCKRMIDAATSGAKGGSE